MSSEPAQRKLCLVFVDSLRTDKLEEAVAEGQAPNFGALLARGELIGDCISAFPSVTPVCTSEIATGVASDQHWISGMNWYHRVERRYVEYGSSFEATRAFGLFRATYDIVYNMNMSHLSHEVDTIFESLGDAGVRTACTPFLIFRGRTRHELGLDGLLKRGAVAAGFRHAVWGPDELFYGELFTSRPVPCKPTLARPATRDEYSACVSKELVSDGEYEYDFLLFSLPDNDHHTHKVGPDGMVESIAWADQCFGEFVTACGGMDEFLEQHSVILVADHGQTAVEHPYDLAGDLGKEWRVLQPSSDTPEQAELAVSPTARAGAVYVLVDKSRQQACHADVRARIAGLEGTDLIAWLRAPDGSAVIRDGSGSPALADDRIEAVIESEGRELRFRPGHGKRDRRGAEWHVRGDRSVLGLVDRRGALDSATYPDGLARLWAALTAPHAGDLLLSLKEGWECVDWGGTSHAGGGSHGSLMAGDSLCPLLLVGFEPGTEATRDQWRLTDVAALVRGHFGLEDPVRVSAAAPSKATA